MESAIPPHMSRVRQKAEDLTASSPMKGKKTLRLVSLRNRKLTKQIIYIREFTENKLIYCYSELRIIRPWIIPTFHLIRTIGWDTATLHWVNLY